MVDLADVGCRKTDLIAVGGISLGGLPGDDLLRELARKCLADRFVDVAGTGDTHRLIDIGTS